MCVKGDNTQGKNSLMNFRGTPSRPAAFDLIDRKTCLSEQETVQKLKRLDLFDVVGEFI
jgi:hypothetical protein